MQLCANSLGEERGDGAQRLDSRVHLGAVDAINPARAAFFKGNTLEGQPCLDLFPISDTLSVGYLALGVEPQYLSWASSPSFFVLILLTLPYTLLVGVYSFGNSISISYDACKSAITRSGKQAGYHGRCIGRGRSSRMPEWQFVNLTSPSQRRNRELQRIVRSRATSYVRTRGKTTVSSGDENFSQNAKSRSNNVSRRVNKANMAVSPYVAVGSGIDDPFNALPIATTKYNSRIIEHCEHCLYHHIGFLVPLFLHIPAPDCRICSRCQFHR